ncbi:PorP/SprF family type IX secretion system membrane protein [Rufibacter sp. LB8]|uniref:PorP/SprF family type IX secretion system membrane protein n=1 Tax=Rufibacter sp. LB8 TaxID=2777781 RepID=UPI00178C5A8F|nr:PorP/SprF family type IX secretion system membrane protein [Rufibacter sp. LB8]
MNFCLKKNYLQDTCLLTGWGHQLREFFLLGTFLLLSQMATAQDLSPTLPFAHRLFLNPAFTGLLSDYSVTLGHRSQWRGINQGYGTQWGSGEYRFKDSKNAAGATFLNDKAMGGGLQTVQAGATYAHHTRLRDNLNLSAGLTLGVGSQSPGSASLIFEDQLGPTGQVQQPTAETAIFERATYLTVGTGLLLFTDQFWVSLAGHGLNQPTLGTASDNSLPATFQMNTGYKFYVKNYFAQNSFQELSFLPVFSYTQQRAFKRLDAAFYAIMTPFTAGVYYTVLPGANNLASTSTISALAGVMHKGFKLGYGYRQSLAGSPVSLGPTHEITVSFEKVDYLKIFKKSGSDKNYNRIACPAF